MTLLKWNWVRYKIANHLFYLNKKENIHERKLYYVMFPSKLLLKEICWRQKKMIELNETQKYLYL